MRTRTIFSVVSRPAVLSKIPPPPLGVGIICQLLSRATVAKPGLRQERRGKVIMTSFNSNYFIHAANVLLLVAYSVRDILWLRLFAVAASLISLPYFVLQPTPQWAPIAWSVFFAGINSFQSWRLYLARRPVRLTHDEEEVRRLAFAQLPSRKVLQLVSLGSWITAAPGDRLIEHGTAARAIALLVRGKVRVSKDGAGPG